MRHVRSICLVLLAACAGNANQSASPYYTPAAPATPATSAATSAIPAAPAAVAREATSPAGDTHVSAGIHPWIETTRDNLSTFAADVDTASYTYARRTLQGGALPPPASVRVEEFVNYFKYGFPTPGPGTPFSVIVDAAPSPLAPSHHIVRVGVATRAIARTQRKPASLVFLIDVSGSMSTPDKLPLALQALRNLVRTGLEPTDKIALVTYAGSTRVVLPLTSAEHRGKILGAIDQISSGGSTAMGAGLDLAYDEAMKGVRPGAISRVVVMSDGDANVGATSHDQMLTMIASRVRAGVTLTTIGFGMGNYRAHLMEQLGDRGNGNNYYVDSLAAANKLFSTDLASMVEVVAKDAKLQIEFDPERVARYRLLGYENRDIPDDAFRNDEVDAGEIGPGHQVTAMYEVQLTEHALAVPGPLAHVRIRHKRPEAQIATEAMFPMRGAPAPTFEAASEDLRFAIAVAAFADVLRGAEDAQAWSLADIAAVARATAQGSPERTELVSLIERARQLRAPRATVAQ